jgi:hypothetical protein
MKGAPIFGNPISKGFTHETKIINYQLFIRVSRVKGVIYVWQVACFEPFMKMLCAGFFLQELPEVIRVYDFSSVRIFYRISKLVFAWNDKINVEHTQMNSWNITMHCIRSSPSPSLLPFQRILNGATVDTGGGGGPPLGRGWKGGEGIMAAAPRMVGAGGRGFTWWRSIDVRGL